MSGSLDNTVRVWDTANVPSPLNEYTRHVGENSVLDFPADIVSLPFKLQQGWVQTSSGESLFWLPEPLRTGFWMPHNTLIIGRSQQTKVSYKNFKHGTKWDKCYTP
ncbi:hypothetical protein B0H16DRAFT_1573492 [Mycena metata]|uniref:Peroxin-7 n=1 Tax=Mycena metata TaxID=1033252 RepID=A0AAD7I958_9AGAR|nr:hypothetical protein B0H16DRAFT_1573492 [Mycena metata]